MAEAPSDTPLSFYFPNNSPTKAEALAFGVDELAKMDPVSIATILVKVTAACLSTAKALYDIRSKFNNAPLSLITISCETSIISATLSKLDNILCERQDLTQVASPEIVDALDASLTGCTVIFSCLNYEISSVTGKSTSNNELSFKGKAKMAWNHERLKELLESLRGQQNAISALIQLVQLDSLIEIKKALDHNQPVLAQSIKRIHSLKQWHPHIKFLESILSPELDFDRQDVFSNPPSISGASHLEFEFDDVIVNSHAYRRALASAEGNTQKMLETGKGVVYEDLIDLHEEGILVNLSDEHEASASEIEQTTGDLECMILVSKLEEKSSDADISPKNVSVSQSRASDTQQPSSPGQAVQDFSQEETKDGGLEGQPMTLARREPFTVTNLDSNPDASSLNILEAVPSISPQLQQEAAFPLPKAEEDEKALIRLGDISLHKTLHKRPGNTVRLGLEKEIGQSKPVKVAVKLVSWRKTLSKRQLLHLNDEIDLVHKLDHPNLVHFQEVIKTENHIGLVMEYIPGGRLSGYCSGFRGWQKKFFAQIISAISFLHQNEIHHHYLTPGNVLVDERKNNIVIAGFFSVHKFDPIAFAVERQVDHQDSNFVDFQNKSQDQLSIMGPLTFYYAPELVLLWEVNQHPDYRGLTPDIWSCGAILYFMLTRRSLYPSVFDNVDDKESTNKKAADFYKQNFSAPLDRIPSPDVALSFNAEHLLLRLLVIDPTKRADLQEIAAYPWLKSYQDILASVRKPDSIPQPQKEPELETRRSPQSSNYSTPSSRKPRLINPRSMFSQSRK